MNTSVHCAECGMLGHRDAIGRLPVTWFRVKTEAGATSHGFNICGSVMEIRDARCIPADRRVQVLAS